MPYSRVKSSIRTLDILELLSNHSEGYSITEIGRELQIPISSLYHLVSTMTDRGYLYHNQRENTYLLGKKIVDLHQAYLANSDLINIAQPVMDSVRNLTGETCSLGVLQGNKIVYIHKRLVGGGPGILDQIGTRKLAHATAAGKVILAYLGDEDLEVLFPEEQLPTSTPNTINNRNQLKQILVEIRNLGFACEDEESKLGVWAIAAPIFNLDRIPIAAISIVGPARDIANENKARWPSILISAATEISYRLGYIPKQEGDKFSR